MRPSIFPPAIVRLSGRPPQPFGKGRPYDDGTVEAVRRLIEGTTLTYHQIAKRTGASPASISRWMQAGGWKRPLFAPRSMLTVPTPRATAYNKHRLLSDRLAALADRYIRELEEARAIDLDKLGQALDLARMAKLAAMRRTPARTEAAMWGEPMRPIAELCAEGVDLHRAPREAVQDFLENRVTPPPEERPPRSRGRGNPRYLTRAQRHARMLEGE
jgi:transcriptional regulator with XRE-family HTH domain